MKMLYEQRTGFLLDAAYVLIGDVDPLMNTTKQIEEILLQNRPLIQKDVETEEKCEAPSPDPEQSLVWICYITDNYGNPIVAKVVSSENLAQQWISDEPQRMGKKGDDDSHGARYTEMYVVEAWQ